MQNYEITEKEIKSILDYILTNNDSVLLTDIPARFQKLYNAFMAKLLKDNAEKRKTNFSLKLKLEKYKETEKTEAEQGNYTETGLDSADIAAAISHHLKEITGKTPYKTTVMNILYLGYASWLHSHRQRICTEHPVATTWGPQFWRAYKRLEGLNAEDFKKKHLEVAEQNPPIAAFLKNCALKYWDYKQDEIKNILLKSMPLTEAAKSGKNNEPIDDRNIYLWKEEQKKTK